MLHRQNNPKWIFFFWLNIHFSLTYTYKYDSSTSQCLRYSNNEMCKIWCKKKRFIRIKISFSSQFGMFHETYQEFEPAHEIMALFVLCKLILQICMRSHPVGLDVWFLVWPFVYFHSSCRRTAKALVRLRGCAGSPEPSLVAYAIRTVISWAGKFTAARRLEHPEQSIHSHTYFVSLLCLPEMAHDWLSKSILFYSILFYSIVKPVIVITSIKPIGTASANQNQASHVCKA